MPNLRCLLVDDEHLALALLEKFIQQTPGLEVAGSCRSAVRAVETLQSEPIDLLFLDIQMPILSGLGLLRSISRPPVTVFTTAYPQHAHEAFDLNAVDYLLKPYSYERFLQAVEKAHGQVALRAGQTVAAAGPQGHLTVRADRRLINLALADLCHIEGWKEYVRIYTAQGERLIVLESLTHLEELLPAEHFLRVHKSHLVARSRVRQLEGDELVLDSGVRVPVARARKRAVVEALFGGEKF